MERIYRSFDGKDFTTEEDCVIYEREKIREKKNGVLYKLKDSAFYTSAGRKVLLQDPGDIDNVFFIVFSDFEALKAFEKLGEFQDSPTITKQHQSPNELAWMWLEGEEQWVSIEVIEQNIAYLKKVLEGFSQNKSDLSLIKILIELGADPFYSLLTPLKKLKEK